MAPPAPPAPNHRLAPPPDVSVEAIRSALSTPGRLTGEDERCPTCHASIQARFCAVCGETRPRHRPQTVIGFLWGAVGRLLDADNRLFRSLYRLLVRPGALTVAFLRGRRQPFLGPLQLFVTINVAYFLFATGGVGLNTFHTPLYLHVGASNFYHQELAQGWVNERIGAPDAWSYFAARAAADSLDRAGVPKEADAKVRAAASPEFLSAFREYAERFDRQAKWLSKSLIFLFIPALAVWFWLLYPSRWWDTEGRFLLPFLVQATHIWGTALVVVAGAVIPWVVVLSLASVLGVSVAEEPILNAVVGVPLVLYVTASLRHVHGGASRTAWFGAGLRAAATFWVIWELLLAYRAALFVIGFYTT